MDGRFVGIHSERQVSAALYDLGVVGDPIVGTHARVKQPLDSVHKVLGADRLAVLPHRVLTQPEGIREAVLADAAVLLAGRLAGHVGQNLAGGRVKAKQGGEDVLGYRYRRSKAGNTWVYVVRLPVQPDAQGLVCCKVTLDIPISLTTTTVAGDEGEQPDRSRDRGDSNIPTG